MNCGFSATTLLRSADLAQENFTKCLVSEWKRCDPDVPVPFGIFLGFIKDQNLSMIRWLVEQDCKLCEDALELATQIGDIEILAYLWENYDGERSNRYFDILISAEGMEEAKSAQVMKWMLQNEFTSDRHLDIVAASLGYICWLDVLYKLYGGKINFNIPIAAAKHDQILVIYWCRGYGIPIDIDSIRQVATRNGAKKVLSWLEKS